MKNLIYSTAVITALIAGTMFTSCQSADKKVDNAENKMQDAQKDLEEAKAKADAEAMKSGDAEAWKAFKAETDQKIKDNEVIIADLKAKKQVAGKKIDAIYVKGIDDVEQKNKDMKMRMDDYEKNHGNWDTFKTEFNHDMEGLGQALKDLVTNNKK